MFQPKAIFADRCSTLTKATSKAVTETRGRPVIRKDDFAPLCEGRFGDVERVRRTSAGNIHKVTDVHWRHAVGRSGQVQHIQSCAVRRCRIVGPRPEPRQVSGVVAEGTSTPRRVCGACVQAADLGRCLQGPTCLVSKGTFWLWYLWTKRTNGRVFFPRSGCGHRRASAMSSSGGVQVFSQILPFGCLAVPSPSDLRVIVTTAGTSASLIMFRPFHVAKGAGRAFKKWQINAHARRQTPQRPRSPVDRPVKRRT